MGRGTRERAVHEAVMQLSRPASATEIAELATKIAGQEIIDTAAGYYLRQNPLVDCIEDQDGAKLTRKYIRKEGVIIR